MFSNLRETFQEFIWPGSAGWIIAFGTASFFLMLARADSGEWISGLELTAIGCAIYRAGLVEGREQGRRDRT